MVGIISKPFVPPKKIWATNASAPLRASDLERLLERVDRIGREVEQVADLVAERLGIPVEDQDTEEEESDEDSKNE